MILWDKYSAFSAGIDRSIRYFDIRDWGNENENFNEDSETQNGYKYSKFLKGHTKSITNLKRLNIKHTVYSKKKKRSCFFVKKSNF